MRRLAFGVVVVALGAALILVGLRSSRPAPASTPTARPVDRVALEPVRRLPDRRPPPTGARRQARRFVAAFLSYEVGLAAGQTEGRIRAGASHAFADKLLGGPAISPARAGPGAVHITSLHVDTIPGHPNLAFASGDADRPEGPEPFSFLFARRAGRWLAVAPGE
jgi:hypothetical protein